MNLIDHLTYLKKGIQTGIQTGLNAIKLGEFPLKSMETERVKQLKKYIQTRLEAIKPRKILRYILLTLLTFGASIILGFLSFGGIIALMPLVSVAIAAFILSVLYDGEIYLQNISGAFHKLSKPKFLERAIAKKYLLECLNEINQQKENRVGEDYPQFFKNYERILFLRDKEKNKEQRAKLDKELKDMEKFFARHALYGNESVEDVPLAMELKAYLKNHGQAEKIALASQRSKLDWVVKAFSVITCGFMALGTTYLLMDAFVSIPALASLAIPALILPISAIGGLAYGFLIYNSITDMIHNETLSKWYHQVKDDLQNRPGGKSKFIAGSAIFLVILALGLTACTAGTWWSIVKKTTPLFAWMKNMPPIIMGGIHPAVTASSALAFNLQNTSESLDIIYDLIYKSGKRVCFECQPAAEGEPVAEVISDIKKAKNRYVLVGDVLYYVTHTKISQTEEMGEGREKESIKYQESYEKVILTDKGQALFTHLAQPKFAERSTIYLSPEDIDNFITKQGGHIPKPPEKPPLNERAKIQWKNLRAQENLGQIFNPFRFILRVIVLPLRIILFTGHLLSISVTGDRVPGIPELASAMLGFISELFEDAHYFMPHAHHHRDPHLTKEQVEKALYEERLGEGASHHHGLDLPTLILRGCLLPLYALATVHDYVASYISPKIDELSGEKTSLSLGDAWDRQWSGKIKTKKPESTDTFDHGAAKSAQTQAPQIIDGVDVDAWKQARAFDRIERHIEKNVEGAIVLNSEALDAEKAALQGLKSQIRHEGQVISRQDLSDILNQAAQSSCKSTATQSVYGKDTFFSAGTTSQELVEKLPNLIAAIG